MSENCASYRLRLRDEFPPISPNRPGKQTLINRSRCSETMLGVDFIVAKIYELRFYRGPHELGKQTLHCGPRANINLLII